MLNVFVTLILADTICMQKLCFRKPRNQKLILSVNFSHAQHGVLEGVVLITSFIFRASVQPKSNKLPQGFPP